MWLFVSLSAGTNGCCWLNKKDLLAWDGHFSFAWVPVVHWPCVRWPPRDLLHDLGLLHPLQLWHIGHDASAAGLKTLCGFQRLVFLGAGGQQLAGPIPHPDLMVNPLLDVAVLQEQRMIDREKGAKLCVWGRWVLMAHVKEHETHTSTHSQTQTHAASKGCSVCLAPSLVILSNV